MQKQGWFRHEDVRDGLVRIWEPGYADWANLWLLDRRVLIDCGAGAQDLCAYLLAEKLVDEPPLVVLTHAHNDHAGGARHFKRVCIHEAEKEMLERGLDEVNWARRTAMWRKHPYPNFKAVEFQVMGDAVVVERTLQEGDIVEGLKVLHLPGHSPGSICFLDERRQWLFSGDVVYACGITIDSFPSSSREKCRESLERLMQLSGYTEAFPGHSTILTPAMVVGQCEEYLLTTESRTFAD